MNIPPNSGAAVTRRGSYDDAAVSARPHLKNLAERRRSAPSLVFGKALGIPWSPIREEASCCVSVDQSPFVLGLSSENGALLLDECVQVTEGTKIRERHLFLFSDVIVFAKLKSSTSYRLKHRVSLADIWLCGVEDETLGEEDGATGDVDLRVTLALAWALNFCLLCFRSPEVKERWLDTLHRKIKSAKARVGCASSPPSVLMKVLSGNITTKTLTGGGMEPFIEFTPDGDEKISALPKPLHNGEDKLTHCSETSKWNLVRRLRRSSGLNNHRCQSDPDTKLFGQPLLKICAHDGSLPKPVTEMLQLLWKKGPSTEGVFRKPCNAKNMRDVRDKLNSGLDVDMDEQPVVLLVGLLKSFLKELPGSLLVSDLYDSWVTALDSEDEMQRALEIKRVVDLLPVPNKLLLQHLVCILHRILEHADTNKMDARNLAVCIAPTLLQLDSTPLEEQCEKLKKLTMLTQFLIEHSELLGENIRNLLDPDEDNADYLSSQHHDSAYDSTDPDGDGEPGECTHGVCGSSSSLCPSTASQSWTSDASFHTSTKSAFNRRCSEPIILLSGDVTNLCSHARSHDDCSVKRKDFEDQPLKKQVSDDSFLLKRQAGARAALSFPKLYSTSNMESLYTLGNGVKDCSCSSLESSTSNQSEGSVFTSSPLGSPACPRRANSINHSTMVTKAPQDIAKPNSDEKRRSQSMRVVGNLPVRSRSLGAFTRRKKLDSQKENSFPCETLQEDSQSEAEVPTEHLHRPRPLSAIEVFKHVDSKLPCRPPPYEQAALQTAGLPPQYRSMTVHDAIQLERRSRPSSVNYDLPPTHPASQYVDSFSQVAQDEGRLVECRQPFRQRAMSESVSTTCHEGISRRFSQPVFEEFSYAKESYV